MLPFLVTDFNNQNKLFVQGSKAFLSPNCHLICNSENKLDLHPCIKKGHQQNLDWTGSDQPLQLTKSQQVRGQGYRGLVARSGPIQGLLQSIKLQLSIWACGKLENVNIYIHVFSCIFLPFPFIAFGPLFPFTDLLLRLTAADVFS